MNIHVTTTVVSMRVMRDIVICHKLYTAVCWFDTLNSGP